MTSSGDAVLRAVTRQRPPAAHRLGDGTRPSALSTSATTARATATADGRFGAATLTRQMTSWAVCALTTLASSARGCLAGDNCECCRVGLMTVLLGDPDGYVIPAGQPTARCAERWASAVAAPMPCVTSMPEECGQRAWPLSSSGLRGSRRDLGGRGGRADVRVPRGRRRSPSRRLDLADPECPRYDAGRARKRAGLPRAVLRVAANASRRAGA